MEGRVRFYKNHYLINFYDYYTDELLYSFANAREILKFQEKPITRMNVRLTCVNLCKALKRKDSNCRFLVKNRKMRVVLIDNDDTEEEY